MGRTPINGNTLMATFTLADSVSVGHVTGITQTGVTWTYQIASTSASNVQAEIWLGVVNSASASKTLTAALSATPDDGASANVCEYAGLATSGFLDQTATATGDGTSQVTTTGTTSATTQNTEVWIGCIASYRNVVQLPTTPQNSFNFLGGDRFCHVQNSYLEYFATAKGTAQTGVTLAYEGGDVNAGCIATFKTASYDPSATVNFASNPTANQNGNVALSAIWSNVSSTEAVTFKTDIPYVITSVQFNLVKLRLSRGNSARYIIRGDGNGGNLPERSDGFNTCGKRRLRHFNINVGLRINNFHVYCSLSNSAKYFLRGCFNYHFKEQR